MTRCLSDLREQTYVLDERLIVTFDKSAAPTNTFDTNMSFNDTSYFVRRRIRTQNDSISVDALCAIDPRSIEMKL